MQDDFLNAATTPLDLGVKLRYLLSNPLKQILTFLLQFLTNQTYAFTLYFCYQVKYKTITWNIFIAIEHT